LWVNVLRKPLSGKCNNKKKVVTYYPSSSQRSHYYSQEYLDQWQYLFMIDYIYVVYSRSKNFALQALISDKDLCFNEWRSIILITNKTNTCTVYQHSTNSREPINYARINDLFIYKRTKIYHFMHAVLKSLSCLVQRILNMV
jgi:hypothetical protein